MTSPVWLARALRPANQDAVEALAQIGLDEPGLFEPRKSRHNQAAFHPAHPDLRLKPGWMADSEFPGLLSLAKKARVPFERRLGQRAHRAKSKPWRGLNAPLVLEAQAMLPDYFARKGLTILPVIDCRQACRQPERAQRGAQSERR